MPETVKLILLVPSKLQTFFLARPNTKLPSKYISPQILDNMLSFLCEHVPVVAWHEQFKDETVADAILDHLVHDSYRLELKGGFMRKITSPLT